MTLQLNKGGDQLWDADKLPEDPNSPGASGNTAVQYNGSFTDYVYGSKAAGKGLNAGAALAYQWKQKGSDNWNYYVNLHWQESSFKVYWNQNYPEAEMLWFWVDTTEYTNGIGLEINLQGCKPKNCNFYTWDGATMPVLGGTTNEWGKAALKAGYKGFVGIALSDFENFNPGNIWQINFHYEPNNSEALPKAIYIDELWLTKLDQVPNI